MALAVLQYDTAITKLRPMMDGTMKTPHAKAMLNRTGHKSFTKLANQIENGDYKLLDVCFDENGEFLSDYINIDWSKTFKRWFNRING